MYNFETSLRHVYNLYKSHVICSESTKNIDTRLRDTLYIPQLSEGLTQTAIDGRSFIHAYQRDARRGRGKKKGKNRNIENQYNLGEFHGDFPDFHENATSKGTRQRSQLKDTVYPYQKFQLTEAILSAWIRCRDNVIREIAIREESSISLSIPGPLTFPFRGQTSTSRRGYRVIGRLRSVVDETSTKRQRGLSSDRSRLACNRRPTKERRPEHEREDRGASRGRF